MSVEIANVIHALAVIELSDPPRFLANFGFDSAAHDDTGQFFLRPTEKLSLTLDKADAVIQVTSLSTPAVVYLATVVGSGPELGNVFLQVLKVSDQTPVDGNFAQVVVFRCPTVD